MARISSKSFLLIVWLLMVTACQTKQFSPPPTGTVSAGENTPTPLIISLPIAINPAPVKISPTTSPAEEQPKSTPTDLSRVMLPFQAKSGRQMDLDWQLVSRTLQGSKENGNFLMDLRYPAIRGSSDAVFKNLIGEIQNWINGETESFLVNVQEATPETWNGFLVSGYSIPSNMSWSMGQNVGNFQSPQPEFTGTEAVFDGGNPVVSILFETMSHFGGEHPTKQYRAINYDLLTGNSLVLADLFQPGEDFLATIARYSMAELHQRPNLSSQRIEKGAAPLFENYTVWSITPFGLMIIFEEEQIGPYSVGSQSVLIPYEKISNIISPLGPLSKWAR